MTAISCSICQNPRSPEMVGDYLRRRSLRVVAAWYGVGYKSLERHLKECVPQMCREVEEKRFREELEAYAENIERVFARRYNPPRLDMRVPRPQPLGLKTNSKITWTRRAKSRAKKETKKA